MKTLAEIIERATPLLREHEGIAAAYVLGSAASGALRADSDIDIALLPVHGRRLSLQNRLELSARLENELGRHVDLGEINSGNPIYASEAILKGCRFFARDIEPEIIHAIVSEGWKDWVAFCAALGLEITP